MNPTFINRARLGVMIVAVLVLVLGSGCSIGGLAGVPVASRGTATPTVRPSFTPRPTNTAWPTTSPSVTPTTLGAGAIVTTTAVPRPGTVTGVITSTVNLRAGPGVNYPSPGRLTKGTKITVRGRDITGEWLVLAPPPTGWVKASLVDLSDEIDGLPVVDGPPTPVPTWTPAPSPTLPSTVVPPMYIDFRADSPWVSPGQCTQLRWDVEGVRGVYLEGQGQPGHGSTEVCPQQTKTFVLHIVLNSGYLDRALTVNVLTAPAGNGK